MQRYHSSLISYIKGRSDFQAKGLERERERERERVRLLIETVLQYSSLMLSSRRGPSIDVLDNIKLIISTDDSVLSIFPTDAFI